MVKSVHGDGEQASRDRDRGSVSEQFQRQLTGTAAVTSVGVRGGGRSKGDPYMISPVLFMKSVWDSWWANRGQGQAGHGRGLPSRNRPRIPVAVR